MKTKIMNSLHKAGMTVSKHSPLLLTIGGVAGLGATAWYSYKAAKKVEVIVEDLEEARSIEETRDHILNIPEGARTLAEEESLEALMDVPPVNRFEVARDIAGAIALPVTLGIASIGCITLSYYILNNRNNMLAAALGTAIAEHTYYRNRIREEYGEERERELHTPQRPTKRTVKVNGKDKEVEANEREYPRTIHGEWFDKSSEYTADDHSYNLAFIKSVEAKLDLRLFQRGHLLLNEVYDALGFERTRAGATLGWTTGSGFALETNVTNAWSNETDFVEPQIYVTWTAPKNVYDKVDYEVIHRGVI